MEDASFIDIILPNYDMVYRRWDYYKEKDPNVKVGEKSTIFYSYPPDDFDMKMIDYIGDSFK